MILSYTRFLTDVLNYDSLHNLYVEFNLTKSNILPTSQFF